MPISTQQHRLVTGLFNRSKVVKCMFDSFVINMVTWLALNLYYVLMLYILLFLCGDIETNPGPSGNILKICHLNVQRLTADKLTEIRASLADKYDIITLSETFLSLSSRLDLYLEGYQPIMRRDRRDGIGGGVAVYCSNYLGISRRSDLESDNIEALWAEVSSSNHKLLLCTCYRAPKMQMLFWDELQYMVDQTRADKVKNIVITGDLNADEHTQPRNNAAMMRFADANAFHVHVDKPTRITESTASILDQFITNIPDNVSDVSISEAPLLTNDHLTIFLSLNFKVKCDKAYDRLVWLYDKADWIGYRNALESADWSPVFENESVDGACRIWTDTVLNIARQFIPNKVIKVRPKDAPFYNSDLRCMKRKVDRKYRLARRSQNPYHWESYCQSRNAYVAAVREAKEEHLLKTASDLRKHEALSPKKWWHTVKQMLGQNKQSQYPPLIDGDLTISDPKSKADAFNHYFIGQTTLCDKHASLPTDYPSFDLSQLNNIVVTEEEVLDQLKGIKANKATGPDLISARMLKEAGSSICLSLTYLFNLSLQQGIVPKMWKDANVIPIHKKKDRCCISNYRPVSILSCVAKLHERIVFKHMYNFFQKNQLITAMQSGFRPGDSTTNQLLDIYHIICKAIDQKKNVRIVFCDISKAFDKVWHKGLLFKLSHAGIKGMLLSWLRNYLSERRQRVTIQGHFSEWAQITAGVPQGSVLGPLLFLIYINDIVKVVKSSIRLFADDTTLYIEATDNQTSADRLNEDLCGISQWARQWLITFSPEKTKSMLCSLRKHGQVPNLYFDGTELNNVDSHCHLGINISYNLSWQKHIDDITAKANKRLDVLCRLSHILDRKTLTIMYNSFIRPVLEYGDIIFNGCTEAQSLQIEAVQKRAARIITGAIRGTPTRTMYDDLGWVTMKERRMYHCLCTFHKIVNNRAPAYLTEQLPVNVGQRTGVNLRNSSRLSLQPARTSLFERSFFPTTTRLWNNLDESVRATSKISIFKKHIQPRKQYNALFSYGFRRMNIIWSRIRLGCSSLKGQLYRMHIIDDPNCSCGYFIEDAEHYFLGCPLYQRQRLPLLDTFHRLGIHPSVNVMLHGSEKLDDSENTIVIQSVFDFIKNSNRFN